MTTPTLRVRAAHHEPLPERALGQRPRDRFFQYQDDLHRSNGVELDAESLRHGDQYTFATVADTLIDRIGLAALDGLDVLATTNWTPEWDPDYSAIGPYLTDRWELGCPVFDVVDRGSIGPSLGLVVLGGYLLGDTSATEGALLGVEQSTVPQAVGAHLPGPTRSGAGLIRLSRTDGPGPRILAMTGLTEDQVLGVAPSGGPLRLVREWCERFEVLGDGLTVVLRRDSYLHRRWSGELWGGRLRFVAPQPSGLTVFSWLSELLADSAGHDGHVLYLDEDVESLSAVAVLLKLGEQR